MKKEQNHLFGQEIKDLFQHISKNQNRYFMGLAIYVLPALCSLFVTDWTAIQSDYPMVIFNTVTRMLSLMLLTLFGFLTKKGKTIYTAGLTIWAVWLLLVSTIKPWVPVVVGIVGLGLTIIAFMYEKNVDNSFKPGEETIPYIKFFYLVFALYIVIEMLHRFDIVDPVVSLIKNPDIAMVNMQVLLFTGLFVMISKRKKFAFIIYSSIWLILAIISLLKIFNVYEPLTLLDIFATVDMASVVWKYFKWFFFVLVALVLVGLVILLVVLARKEKKLHVVGGRLVTVLSAILILVLSFMATTHLSYTKFKSTKIIENYYEQGFASSLLRYVATSIPVKAEETEELNMEKISEVVAEHFEGKEVPSTIQNVIIIQMESFCDSDLFLKYNEDLSYETDPMPFIHSLMKNYSTGNVGVPVFAGQTCKSEFELLTGVNIDTLPGGFNPYVTSLNGDTQIDSLARYFDECGYTTTAIHNYQGEFFSRDRVYKNLGFDYFIPVECMPNAERRGIDIWSGDSVIAEEIEKSLDANGEGKNFIFTVSMQLHGSYPSLQESEYPMAINGLDDDKITKGKLAYYIQELQKFDNAIKAIVESAEAREEETVIVFYADHLPQIARDLCNLTNEETFTTNYIIWDNVGLEKETKDCELYQLSTVLFDKLDVTGSFMNKFNRLYSDFDAQEIVGYEMTFENTDFRNDDYRIGLYDPEIISVELISSEHNQNTYSITGKNFTADTYITINGKIYDITVENENKAKLTLSWKKLENGNTLTARILGERLNTLFCESDAFVVSGN